MCCRNDLNYTAASCLTEDRTSKQILESLKMSIENKIPIYVSRDEHCLFNAISVNLFGNEKLATQIRVLTCIEMVMNTSLYDNEKYQRLILVSPSYDMHAKMLLSRELIRRHGLCLLHLL